jgi:hypothetical protein
MEQSMPQKSNQNPLVLMISGTCCYPQLASLDKQVEEIINQAIKETGIQAEFRKTTASSAVMGGIPMEVLRSSGLASDVSNIMRLPAILINNKLVSLGIPKLDEIKTALLQSK